MKRITYQQELAELADEMQADNPRLTRKVALKRAREQMESLYRLALDYDRRAAVQRSQQVPAA